MSKRLDILRASLEKKLDESIRKTQDAIEREECTIRHVEKTTAELPDSIRALIASGELVQWRKYPNICFVAGVEKARIGWDEKKKVVYHKFYDEIQDEKQRKTFANIYNTLNKQLNGMKS